MSAPQIIEAKQRILDAIQAYHALAAVEDSEPQRTVLDWIVVYHARNFEEPWASGGEYSLIYAQGMQYHSMVGLLDVGVDTLESADSD